MLSISAAIFNMFIWIGGAWNTVLETKIKLQAHLQVKIYKAFEYLDLLKDATLAPIIFVFSILNLYIFFKSQNAWVMILQGLDQMSYFCPELLTTK